MPRKVAIQRIRGKEHPNVPLNAVHEGWEVTPPVVGETYKLFKDNGSVFRCSRVTQVDGEMFRTKNSMYALKVLELMEAPKWENPSTDTEKAAQQDVLDQLSWTSLT